MHKISTRLGRMLLLSAAPCFGLAMTAPAAAQTVPMDSAFAAMTGFYYPTPGETLLAVQNTTVNSTPVTSGLLTIDASTYTVNFAQSIVGGTNPLTITSSSPGNGEIIVQGALSAGTLTINQTTLQVSSNTQVSSTVDNGTLIASLSFGGPQVSLGTLNGAGSLQLVANSSAPSPGGVVSISDASGFTGAITIGSGTTLSTGVPMSGNVTDNGTLTLGTNFQTTYAQVISGSGTVAITAPNSGVTFTNNQTYTGTTTVNANATLQLGNGGTSGSLAGNVVDGGTLIYDRSDTYVVPYNISGNGIVEVGGTGTMVLTGNAAFPTSYLGISQVLSGATLQIGNGGTSGSIGGPVQNNGTLVFDRSDTYTYNSQILGAGEVNQAGTGTLVLDSFNPNTGEMLVSAGTLVVGDAAHQGAVLSSATVNIQPGATLEGYGTLTGAVTNSGTVTPGNGLGTLTVGSYAQTAAGKLAIDVAPGNIGLLNVTGNASLNGTLAVTLNSALGPGQYTFLDAGSITGRFSNVVVSDPPALLTGVYYTPTTASLIVVSSAGTQLAGAFLRNTLDTAENLDDAIFAHLDNQNCREPGNHPNDLPACPELSVWRQIFGGVGAIDGTTDLNAVSSRWAGFAGGIDVHTDMGFWLGLSASYERNELGVADDNGQVGTNVFSMTLTGGLPVLWGRLDSMASFHMYDGDSKRMASVNGSNVNAEGSPKNTIWDAAVQYEQNLLGDALSGFARLTYVNLDAGSYAESGAAPLDFQFNSKSYSAGYGDLGLHYSNVFVLHSGTQIIPEASAGARVIIGNTLPDLQVQLANAQGASSVVVPELDRDRVAFKANLGVTAQKHGLSYYIRLDGLIGGNQREGAIMIGAASRF